MACSTLAIDAADELWSIRSVVFLGPPKDQEVRCYEYYALFFDNRLEASRELMKKYCMIAFPKDSSKHLTFHALRHCYAINLLTKGVSMSLVAQSLGNTLSVCQQHYLGFELTNDSIAAIKSIISGRGGCEYIGLSSTNFRTKLLMKIVKIFGLGQRIPGRVIYRIFFRF